VPFDVVPATQDLVEYRDGVAESIVERVTNSTPGSVSVMGPSTTRAFGALTMIDTIRGRTGAAYALSGRVRRRGESFEIFAQLIRADDRGHIWVAKWLDSTPTGASSASIGQRIGDSVSTILLHADSPRRPALPDHRPKGAN
jgi:TolB-like protein